MSRYPESKPNLLNQKPEVLCKKHNESIKGFCLYPDICSHRVLCRFCRQEHDEKHLKFYEDLKYIMEGDIFENLNQITKKVEIINQKILTCNESTSIALNELGQEFQKSINEVMNNEKMRIQTLFKEQIDLNGSIISELSNTKKELETKIKKVQNSKSQNSLQDLACYFARIQNRFLNNESSFNKYVHFVDMEQTKVSDMKIFDKLKKSINNTLETYMNQLKSYFPPNQFPLEANLLPEFNPDKLKYESSIDTAHKGIWWGALVYFQPKNLIISGGNEGSIKFWDLKTRELVKKIDTDHGWISKLYIIPEKRLLMSGGQDCTVKVWDIESNITKPKFIFSEHLKEIYCIEYIPEYELVASGGNDGTIKLWDVDDGELIQTIWAEGEIFRCLCYLKHLRWIAAGLKSGAILVFRVERENPELMYSIKFDEMSSILCIKYIESEDIIISGEIDGKISIWKLGKDEGICVAAYKTAGAVYNIEAFYHQDYLFYTNDDNKWRVLRLSSGEVVKEFSGNSKEKGGTCLIWTKKKYNVITGFTDEIRIWEYDCISI